MQLPLAEERDEVDPEEAFQAEVVPKVASDFALKVATFYRSPKRVATQGRKTRSADLPTGVAAPGQPGAYLLSF